VLAIFQFHSHFAAFTLRFASHHSSEYFQFGISAGTARAIPQIAKAERQHKSPASIPAQLAGTERRARFSYEDLLALFSFVEHKQWICGN
jgi:hypothetical protein